MENNNETKVLRGNWQNLFTLTCIGCMLVGVALGAVIDILLLHSHLYICTIILGLIGLGLGVWSRKYFLRKQAADSEKRRFHI